MTVEELQILMTANSENLKKEINNVKKQLNSLEKQATSKLTNIKNIFKTLIPIASVTAGVIALKNFVNSSEEAYKSQIQNETRLIAVMKQLSNARKQDVKDILALTDAQQRLGVVGDEVQLAGAQELATYVDKADSIKKLIPQLNNMIAQQYGYNATQEEAINIATMMGKVLEGQTGALSRYGYYFDENQEKILKFGTEEQKVAVLTDIIHDSIGDVNQALGDTPIGRQIQLANAWGDVKEQIGYVATQIKQVLIPVFQVLVSWIGTAVSYLRQFLQVLGFTAKKQNTATKSLGAGTSAQKKYGDAVNSSNKKQKDALATFDEMNVLKETNTGSSGSGDSSTGNGGGGGGFNDVDFNIGIDGDVEVSDKVTTFVEKIKSLFGELDFSNLIASFDNLKNAVLPVIDSLMEGLGWLVEDILIPIGAWTINELIPAFFNTLAGAFQILQPVLNGVKIGLKWLWDNFLSPIAKWTGGVIVDVLNAIGDAISWISEQQALVDFLEGVGVALGIIVGVITAYNAVMAICNVVTGIFSAIMTVLTSPITLVVLAITALIAIIYVLIKNWDKVKEFAVNCWNKIKEVWNSVADWFNTKVVQPVANFFSNMWNGLKNGAKSAWEGIKSVFSTVASFFKNIFTNAWTAVKNVFSTGGKIFDGIKDGIVNAFKTIVNAIITGINKVVAIPFNAINSVLRKIRNVSILGYEPFSWIKEFGVPQIPKLARGGVVDKPTVAMIGEAGKEAIMPLENNTGWITELAEKISDRNGGQPIQLVVKIGEDTILNKVLEGISQKSFENNGEVFNL